MKPTTKITIDGTQLNDFTHLSLTQKIYDHHSFKIVIGHEVIEEIGGHTLDKSKDWVGKSAIITLGENDFVGIVTSVNMAHNHGLFGDLIITGYSNTILLESGAHLFSWTEKSLKDVIQETIDTAGINAIVKPEYKDTIGYIAQHRESNYGFIKRVASQFNEWMFYDGEQLLFGKPGDLPTVPIAYGTDMDNVQVSVNMRPVKLKAFSYHSTRDEQIDGNTVDTVSGLDELGDHGFTASKDNFSFAPRVSMGPRIPDKSNLDKVLERLQSAAAANLSTISGSSSKQELRPGVIADIKANIFDKKSWNTKPYGQYLVVAVHHQATGDNVYSNHFEAIPASVKVLPEPTVPMPQAYPQIATVMTNADPDGKGRIQVQFQWQQLEGLNTNWIRVMTPDAGSSDLHPQNRGQVFIPEDGDQVMIGFRHGDPSRPFVMGSMYHGVNSKGGDKKNVIKSMITRSGHELVFDDTEGKEKITINDKNGNTIEIDTVDNSINMTALSSINMTAPTITMLASNAIMMNAGGIIEGAAGMNVSFGAGIAASFIAGKNAIIQAGKMLSATGGKNVKLGSGSGANIELEAKGKVIMKSSKELDISSKESTIRGSKKANILSKKAYLEGSTKTVIKGNKVDIS